jgi:PAS domain S-box-containing protein
VDFACRIRAENDAIRLIRMILTAEHAPGGRGVIGIRCVSRDVTTQTRTVQRQAKLSAQAEELSRRLERIMASVPGIVWEQWGQRDPLQLRTDFISEGITTLTGYSTEDWLTRPEFWLEIMHPDDREEAIEAGHRVLTDGEASVQYRWFTRDGRTIWVESNMRLLRDEAGAPLGMSGVTVDITQRKRAEEEQARLREELIASQGHLLAELSTPLIPISNQVLAMPLIGAIDQARAERVVEILLQGISARGARVAILDITGVPTVDTKVADTLMRAARGVQLLGAEVVLTGIRAEVAQTLVALGVDLGSIATRGTLQDGIRYATRRR